jgi:hypothetical protein
MDLAPTVVKNSVEAIFRYPPPSSGPGPESSPPTVREETACALILRLGLLSVDELAKAKGVHPRTIYKWTDRVVDDPGERDRVRQLIRLGGR